MSLQKFFQDDLLEVVMEVMGELGTALNSSIM